MSWEKVCHLVVGLCAIVLIFSSIAEAQECTADDLIVNLGPRGRNLVARSLAFDARREAPAVTILDHNIVCLATNYVWGQYRQASVVVNYTCSGFACPLHSK